MYFLPLCLTFKLTSVTNTQRRLMYVPMFKKWPSIRMFWWIFLSISSKNTISYLCAGPSRLSCWRRHHCNLWYCPVFPFLMWKWETLFFFKAWCSYCSYTLIIAKSGLKQLVKCYFVLSMKVLSHISQSAHISWRQHDWGGPWAFFIMLSLTIPHPSQLKPRPQLQIRSKTLKFEDIQFVTEKISIKII